MQLAISIARSLKVGHLNQTATITEKLNTKTSADPLK